MTDASPTARRSPYRIEDCIVTLTNHYSRESYQTRMSEQPSHDPPTGEVRPIAPVEPQVMSVYRRRGPNTLGCIVIAVTALVIAAGLIVVGLFLPPFNLAESLFGPEFVMFDGQNNAAAADGLRVIVNDVDEADGFGVALRALSAEAFASDEDNAAARRAAPAALMAAGPIYRLDTVGRVPSGIALDFDLPEGADLDTLDVYGYDAQTDRWRFLPSQLTQAGTLLVSSTRVVDYVGLFSASPVDPVVVVPVEITQDLTHEAAQLASIVSPAGLTPNAAGQLIGSLAPGFVTNAAYRVMPVVRNFNDPRAIDVQTVVDLIRDPALRQAHILNLVSVAISSGFDGLFVEYRGLPLDIRDEFSDFVSELKQAFSSNGLLLGVIVPAPENTGGEWDTGVFDWRVIGQVTDYLQVDLGLDPLAFAPGPDQRIEALFRWATREVSRYKLLAGLNALSLRETRGGFVPVSYADALSKLGNVQVAGSVTAPGEVIRARLDGFDALPGVETAVQAPYILYRNPDGSAVEKVWLTTAGALRFRLDQLRPHMIGGVALSDLSSGGLAAGVPEAVLNFKLSLPIEPSVPDLSLRWRVQDNSGVRSEVITGLNEELVVTLEAVEGNFAINVEVVDGEQAVARSGAQVAVLRPTPTPTLLPTAEPTLIPTETPTLSPIIPTRSAQFGPGSQFAAVNPGPGSIITGVFEYGGQVTSVESQAAIDAMQRAGMTWMKVQVRYSPGTGPEAIADVVRTGRDRGFKMLVSAVGSPNDLALGGGGYIQGFANWLAGIASAGPDGIEVWNEPNIDREWPRGQISGANYVAMLASAYNAIKSVSPGTIVISAAPAPTGGELDFPAGAVRNDDAWLAEVVAAGGLNYLDCVGVHYNEGIVPPSATSGDPRGDYYTRFFTSMINVYSGITNRPLCFTELGYVTPEGYGTIAPNFAWGANTTVAQQAAWLAEAMAIASQSGRVKLLIVWNVDFRTYDANDPQAGYAIIRPGGGCPACDAIAGAR